MSDWVADMWLIGHSRSDVSVCRGCSDSDTCKPWLLVYNGPEIVLSWGPSTISIPRVGARLLVGVVSSFTTVLLTFGVAP